MTWMLLAALLAATPLDGRDRPVRDDLLEQLAGPWKLTGTRRAGWRILTKQQDASGQ